MVWMNLIFSCRPRQLSRCQTDDKCKCETQLNSSAKLNVPKAHSIDSTKLIQEEQIKCKISRPLGAITKLGVQQSHCPINNLGCLAKRFPWLVLINHSWGHNLVTSKGQFWQDNEFISARRLFPPETNNWPGSLDWIRSPTKVHNFPISLKHWTGSSPYIEGDGRPLCQSHHHPHHHEADISLHRAGGVGRGDGRDRGGDEEGA